MERAVILNAIAETLKRQSKDDFKGRHFEAWLIIQAVSWYLRYPLSYRNIEEMFLERGFEVDHRWGIRPAGGNPRPRSGSCTSG
jgi:IS6 family transposase